LQPLEQRLKHALRTIAIEELVRYAEDSTNLQGTDLPCPQETDNGTISPVIQTTNGSRVPSSRPRTDVRPNGKDTRSNVEHKVERKR